MRSFNINLSEEELNVVISSLLFSSSVNIISESNRTYPLQLIDVAKKLKGYYPDIKLNSIQFIQEDNYEEEWSDDVLQNFKSNLSITNFENV
jgi:hypothetical protein